MERVGNSHSTTATVGNGACMANRRSLARNQLACLLVGEIFAGDSPN
jgi:hypothetical protein